MYFVFLPQCLFTLKPVEAERCWPLRLLSPPSSFLLPSAHYRQCWTISTSISLTPWVTCVAKRCPTLSPQKKQVSSMRLFVCSLPALHRAALSYSQQVAHLAAQQQRLGVLRHTSCFKWKFWSKPHRDALTGWSILSMCSVWKKILTSTFYFPSSQTTKWGHFHWTVVQALQAVEK